MYAARKSATSTFASERGVAAAPNAADGTRKTNGRRMNSASASRTGGDRYPKKLLE